MIKQKHTFISSEEDDMTVLGRVGEGEFEGRADEDGWQAVVGRQGMH